MHGAVRALVALIAALVASTSAGAATFTVTRTDDPGPAPVCGPADCSLRAAFDAANGAPGLDSVVLPAGTYTLVGGALPDVTSPLVLRGAGSAQTTITGGVATGPATTYRAGVFVTRVLTSVSGITFSGNRATSTDPVNDTIVVGAGAIVSDGGNLTLLDVVIAGNVLAGRTVAGAGGVVSSAGALVARNVAVTGNVVSAQSVAVAGGVTLNGDTESVLESTLVADNRLTGRAVSGAGGVLSNVTPLTLVNSTISGNVADPAAPSTTVAGGVYSNDSSLTVRHATIALNTATGPSAAAGNVYNAGAGLRTIVGSIVAGGTSPVSPTCEGPFTSIGGNVEDAASCGLGADDRPATDPLLEPLADNGGPTRTHALAPTSPALALAPIGACEATDQRGVLRPQGGACDAGAFELGVPTSAAPPTVTGTALVGQQLSCAPGTWRGGPAFAFAWLRDGSAIPGAAADRYVLSAADSSAAVQCQVTATNVVGSAAAVSAPVGVDAPPLPTPGGPPTVAGTARLGLTVTCANGAWTGAASFAFAWLRNGVAIPGATATTLTLAKQDVGRALQCRVTASGAGGSTVADSAPRVPARACIVPALRGLTLAAARGRLARAGCAVGKVTTRSSSTATSGRVLGSTPKAGANRPLGTRVALTIAA